jgi:cell wall-associated NlpC family hydrolase
MTALVRGRVAALAVVAAVALGTAAAPVWADPEPPGSDELAQARADERLAAASVADLESALSALSAKSARAQEKAGLAAEAYNATAVDLADAKRAEARAETDAAEAATALDAARGALARVALSANQGKTAIAKIEPFLTADGLDDALARAELIEIAGTASDRAADRFAVAEQRAEATSERAGEAVGLRADKAAAAERAAEKADRAATAARQQEEAAAAEHAQLIAVLAEKKKTTVALEEQAEQERIAAANEAARKAKEAEQALTANPVAPPTKAAEPEPTAPAASAPPSAKPTPGASAPPSAKPTAKPTTKPTTKPKPSPSPSSDPGDDGEGETDPPGGGESSSAAKGQAAVEWARAQIGKPYQWGGSGPNSFDCSGLTSQAWLNGGGKSIPRTAAAQYAAATKLSYDSMRPGDLIFWGASAAGIYHVAIYSGGGMMIEAPRSGELVKEIPVRWSGTYGYAGRF